MHMYLRSRISNYSHSIRDLEFILVYVLPTSGSGLFGADLQTGCYKERYVNFQKLHGGSGFQVCKGFLDYPSVVGGRKGFSC